MPKDKVPLLTCRVVGVTFENRQKVLQHLLKGQDTRAILVHLVPEPDNAYDPNAIKVLAMGEQIGYIPREAAEDVLLSMGLGMIHERQKATIGCTAKKNGGFIYWASLRIFESVTSARKKPDTENPKTHSDKPRRVIDLRKLED